MTSRGWCHVAKHETCLQGVEVVPQADRQTGDFTCYDAQVKALPCATAVRFDSIQLDHLTGSGEQELSCQITDGGRGSVS